MKKLNIGIFIFDGVDSHRGGRERVRTRRLNTPEHAEANGDA
jgi:hypothetical protein